MGLSLIQWGALGALTLTLANGITIEPAIAQSGPRLLSQRASSSGSSGRSSQATLVFVNPTQGRDHPGGGSEAQPLRTLTYALRRAEANTVIFLSPGTYNRANGEVFPLRLPSGVTLYGNPRGQGQGVMISGGGSLDSAYGSQHTAIAAADGSGLNGVTVSNPQGHGIWLASGRLWVVNSTFEGNGNQGVAIAPTAEASSQDNRFVNNRGNIGRLATRSRLGSSASTPALIPTEREATEREATETESTEGVEVLSWGNASALSVQQRSPSVSFDKPPLAYQPPQSSYPVPISTRGELPPLRVPDGNVPIGDRGHLPLPPTTALSNRPGAPPPPPSYASVNVPPTRLQFRITVVPRSNSDRELVQLLMPDALTLRRRDGHITQSAAFRHRDRAEAVLDALQRHGIQASLQSLGNGE
ncbi:MAG: Protein of unknown function (DUF1565) [Phormidium sp. OSCR]|nr:MAG: Protein of unknown function (DUF1565) [Phormidium sp. OSCR]